MRKEKKIHLSSAFSMVLAKAKTIVSARANAVSVSKSSPIRTNSDDCVPEKTWQELTAQLASPNELYGYLDSYFRVRSPAFLREHRQYFMEDARGFGEDAFHAMWWLLLLDARPENCLEIGVYRGQVISLWGLISKVIGLRANVWGISPLSSVGDSVSNYPEEVDYEKDIAESYARFGLGRPQLLRSYSTDEASCQFVASRAWDLIYIDGSHDEGVVAHDYSIASAALREGGVLVFDDAALEFGYLPGPQSFAGHPGPSSVANRIAAKEMDLVAVVGHNVVFRKR